MAFDPEAALGLSQAEASRRLVEDGPNTLPTARGPSHLRELIAQMTHLFAVMLWVAAGLALLAKTPELAAAIVIVILVNGLFAFVQEVRAERAAAQLRTLLPRRATVVRDGQVGEIDATQLVRGDIVRLAIGNRVSADIKLMDATSLAVDVSMLTGESVPARPGAGDEVFAGTYVVEGAGSGVVVATGANTRLAGVAAMTAGRKAPRTPLTKELEELVHKIAIIAASVGVLFFLAGVVVGLPTTDGFLFAVGVTVALVPEGLLPTITLSLALAARRMADRHALVRRLDAVETLGATTFICTDKTGTLTQNKMSVVTVWCPAGRAVIAGEGYDPTSAKIDVPVDAQRQVRALARAAARCSVGRAVLRDGHWVAEGDPMEAALDVLARRFGLDLARDARELPLVRTIPFDPHRRRMSVVIGDEIVVKGAPDAILPRCRGTNTKQCEAVLAELAKRGLRVLAVAERSAHGVQVDGDADDVESDLTLLGIVGLTDPPRPGVATTLARCRKAGLRVAMVTGDHAATAEAIAREIGLSLPGSPVIRGDELPKDDAILGATLDRDGIVVCRVLPEHKLRIAQALQSRGHVVAMTGDGVNDAPALKQADVGVAMGRSGTDVAREAADLVLLDDDFTTIVHAITYGRSTFANLRRVLVYHITDNVAQLAPFVLWALTAGRFPLALGVLQILCLELVTDQLPALALGSEQPPEEKSFQPPPRRHIFDKQLLVRAFIGLGLTEAIVAIGAFVFALHVAGARIAPNVPVDVLRAASGATFLAIVVGQMANALACRSPVRPAWRVHRPGRMLLVALGVAVATALALVYVPALASILRHAPPPPQALVIVLLAAPAILVADAIYKRARAIRRSSAFPLWHPSATRPS